MNDFYNTISRLEKQGLEANVLNGPPQRLKNVSHPNSFVMAYLLFNPAVSWLFCFSPANRIFLR